MKKILISAVLLTLTLSVTGCSENECIRYIDYTGKEHIMKNDNWDNHCGFSYGNGYCYEGDKRISVKEFEYIECEVHYES